MVEPPGSSVEVDSCAGSSGSSSRSWSAPPLPGPFRLPARSRGSRSIVGPVGDLTDYYRSIGADAAREARRWTSDVVSVVSPNATWPAVRRALRGASVVVYLGHGNGWPSPYRDALYPPTQDGLGLNPVAGGGDSAHQYFGEAYLAREIRLAPGAVVLLHHLCYASGNSEPGLPEGSLERRPPASRQLRRGLARAPAPRRSSPTRSVRRSRTCAPCSGRTPRSTGSGVTRRRSTTTS